MSRLVLRLAIFFTVVFGFLTFYELFANGPDPLGVLSLLVLAAILFGVVGVLRQPPED